VRRRRTDCQAAGVRITLLRETLEFSQEKLAQRAGVAVGTINSAESGGCIQGIKLLKIAKNGLGLRDAKQIDTKYSSEWISDAELAGLVFSSTQAASDAEPLTQSHAVTSAVQQGTYRFFPPGIDDAVRDLKRRALEAIKSGEEILIRWLGVTMRYGAAHLSDFSTIAKQTPIKLELAMLDPDWKQLPVIHRDWKKEAAGGFTTLLGFLERERAKRKSQISGRLFVYRAEPHIHGFSLNKRFYYVSWAYRDEHDILHIVGSQGYDFFELGRSQRDDTRIALFDAWFEYFCRHGEQKFPRGVRQKPKRRMRGRS
jgi:transcriptional regulator with XRE-family HTH domain